MLRIDHGLCLLAWHCGLRGGGVFHHNDVKERKGLLTEFSISQNHPNPFDPSTKIRFALPKSVTTKLTIYDLLGRKVRTFVDKEMKVG